MPLHSRTLSEEFGDALAGRRVLVTGASGFIGRHLVQRLSGESEVMALLSPRAPEAEKEKLPPGVTSAAIDVRDRSRLAACMRLFRPVTVFHLAASGLRPGDPAGLVESVNVDGTRSVLAGAVDACVAHLVFTGSWFEYGDASVGGSRTPLPATPYGQSKLAATQLVQAFAVENKRSAVVLRPFQVYGPSEPSHRLIPYVLNCARQGQAPRLQNPNVLKDWIYVQDVVDALVCAAGVVGHGQAVDLGTGVLTSVSTIVEMVLSAVGAAPVAVKHGGAGSDSDRGRSRAADTSVAQSVLGWRASTGVVAGVRETVDAWANLAH